MNWNLNEKDHIMLDRVLFRAIGLFKLSEAERANLQMTLTACHLNGCQLSFQKMLECDEFTFKHDIFGIEKHIDTDTGKLENCFLPRCALPERAVLVGDIMTEDYSLARRYYK